MPNFDSGIYFLTVLAPVDNRQLLKDGDNGASPVQMLRQKLQTLPTALQSPPTVETGRNSPFSQSPRTHFARLVVINDVAYNGREPSNALLNSISGTNPIIAQEIDRLNCPYLLFVVDFDAASGEPAELESYLTELWSVMEAELREIFQYCWKFDGVETAAAFVAYIQKCQIETTMPFHDYWEDRPQLGNYPRTPGSLAVTALLPAALMLILSLFAQLPLFFILCNVGFFFVVGLCFVRWRIERLSQRPFPQPPRASLPEVLKALHLQHAFGEFAFEHQGIEPPALHAAFGQFLAQHKPNDIRSPTQAAGTIPT